MFNASFTENAAPAGFGVLELIADPHAGDDDRGLHVIERAPRADWRRRHAPLERTTLTGTITGPLAALRLVQRFRVTDLPNGTVEARYRFPLPGDAAVLGVVVRFGDTTVHTTLAERGEARERYAEAKYQGFQAALLERESPDVFTLSITGLGAESVEVETRYVQRAATARGRWSLRVPLTTTPRFVRADELGLPQADANPLAVLADPGHTFRLDVALRGVGALDVSSPTHPLRVEPSDDGAVRVTLVAGDVVPDRDCVLEWRPSAAATPALHVVTEDGPDGAYRYALALVTPPAAPASTLPRDLLLLVDRSGSMGGPKWEATRWAVRRLLGALGPSDRFQLGLFDDTVVWLDGAALPADAAARAHAERFLDAHGPNGGTELGAALEASLVARPRVAAQGVARHVLIVTDGQVTDEGRILATLDREAARVDARRVSVLCIDSAPNASLATAIAERGRGGAHFLSSDPSDADVATALDDALARFAAPVATGLALEVDRDGVESPARSVRHLGTSRAASRLDLGDLVAGHPAWVVLRLPAAAAAGATVTVSGAGVAPIALALPAPEGATPEGSVRAAFGAERVRVLEQLRARRVTSADAVRNELTRLGYDPAAVGVPVESTVYAENAAAAVQSALRALVVRESLEAGVPSTETAFVAVREVPGHAPARTVDVACALPAGWSGAFETGTAAFCPPAMPMASPADMAVPRFSPMPGSARGVPARRRMMRPASPAQSEAPRARPSPAFFDRLGDLPDMASAAMGALFQKRGGGGHDGAPPLFDGVPSDGTEVALFDSDSDAGSIPSHIVRAVVRVSGDVDAIGPDAELLLYVGDLAQPVARIALAATLAAGGERPLNVRRARNERVRIVLSLGGGATWPAAAGRLAVSLGG
jgi:Ca-activated chloride channel family protein